MKSNNQPIAPFWKNILKAIANLNVAQLETEAIVERQERQITILENKLVELQRKLNESNSPIN